MRDAAGSLAEPFRPVGPTLATALVIALVLSVAGTFAVAAAPLAANHAADAAAGPPAADPAGDLAVARDAPEATRLGATAGALGTAESPLAAELGTGAPERNDAAVAVDDADAIRSTQTLGLLPDRPGHVRVNDSYRVPDRLATLEVRPPSEATVVDADGFEPTADGRYAWDGETAHPALRFHLAVNRTVDRDDPLAGPGRYTFVDVGEWAVVQRPQMGYAWSWRGDPEVRFDRSLEASPGAAGSTVAYLGEYEERTHEAHGQRFRLVVPRAADMAEDPDAVFDEFAYGADALRVGDRDETVFALAAPTEGVRWGVRGLQTGDADLWVRDSETVADVDNVWAHEYVHTRQDYRTDDDARWVTEATASYYATLFALERGHVGFESFAERLRTAFRPTYDDVVLADRAGWRGNPDYHVGALVAADLDRRIRLASDSERTLSTVVRSLNAESEPVGATDLREAVGAAGGDEAAAAAERFTSTTERPAVWDGTAHAAAFGATPARVGVRPAASNASIRVDGPYRNRSVDAPFVLAVGERASVALVAENFGGTTGEYDVALRRNGTTLDRATGRLAPGETAALTLSATLDDPGEAVLAAGDARYPVSVREPSVPVVTGLRTDVRRVSPGDSIALAVDLRNDADRPGARRLSVTVDGETATERPVRLDAAAERTVTATVSLSDPGRHRIEVADADASPVRVRVVRPGPPLGVLGGVAAIALLVAALLAGFRYGSN